MLRACLAVDPSQAHLEDSLGRQPLHHAAAALQAEAVAELLAAGADAGAADHADHRSAAHMLAATDAGRLSAAQRTAAGTILRQLVAAGIDFAVHTDSEAATPLHLALEAGNLELLQLLIQHCGGMSHVAAAANQRLLCGLVRAAQCPSIADDAMRLLGELLEKGAPVGGYCTGGSSLLLTAAQAAPGMDRRHVAPLLRLLLQHGADPGQWMSRWVVASSPCTSLLTHGLVVFGPQLAGSSASACLLLDGPAQSLCRHASHTLHAGARRVPPPGQRAWLPKRQPWCHG